MLELSQIGFSVNTKPLEEAATKLAALGTAAGKLAGDLKKLDKASADAAINQNKVNLVAEKTATQAAKTAEVLERTETKKLKAIEKTTKATRDAQAAQVGLVDSMERKRDLISEGWTRGESSILKTAEAIGIVGDEYKRLQSLLKDIGGLVSSPFDSSLGSLRSIQKEFDGLVLRSKLVDQGIELTTTQLKQFARIAAEASVAVKKMGMDPTEGAGLSAYNKLLTDAQDEYLKVAVASKSMLDGEKLLAKQHRDTASAKSFLIKEDERMVSVTEQLNTGTNRSVSISEKAAIATANYARALKTAGVAGDEAKTRLAKYSAAQQLASQKEEQRAAANLARALQPQATDVLVSLWSGQNPLTVMLQQGGQVVDLFKLSGVEAGKLGTTMKAAFAGMLPSVVAVGSAVGGLLKDGIVALGKGFTDMISNMSGVSKVSELAKRGLASMGQDGFEYIGKLNGALRVMQFALGAAALASVAALVSLAVAIKEVIKQESELSKAINLNGGSLGLTTQAAQDLAVAYGSAKGNIGSFSEAITEAAKAGNITKQNLEAVTSAAVMLNKVAGVAVADTAKEFSKLAEEPTKAIAALAKEIGLIDPEVIRMVDQLEKAGKKTEAAAIATRAYSDAIKEASTNIRNEMGTWQVIFSTVGEYASGMWNKILNIGRKGSLQDQLKEATNNLKETVTKGEKWYQLSEAKGGTGYKEEVEGLQEIVNSIQSRIDKENELGTLKERNSKMSAVELERSKMLEEFAAPRNKREDAITKAKELYSKFASDVLTNEKDSVKQKEKLNQLSREEAELIKNINDKYKDKKTPKDKVENYFDKIKERVNDLKIDVEGYIIELTKSEKLLKDLQDDKQWKAAPESKKGEKAALEAELGILAAKERQNLELDKQKKLQEEIVKIQQSTTEFILKQEQENTKLTTGYALQMELLGKTEEQQKKIKEAYELQGKVQKVNYEFAQKELKIREDTDAAIRKGLSQKAMVEIVKAEQAELAKLDIARGEALGVIYQGVAVQASVDYYNEMKKVASELAGVISTALFEGGEAGSKKLRDYLVNLLRQKITLEIEANITSLLTSNGGGNSGGMLGALDSLAGLVSGGAGGSMSNGLMSLIGGSKNIGNTLVKGAGAASDWLNTAGFTNLGKGFESISNAIAPFSQTINKVSDSLGYLNSAILATEGKWGAAIGSAIGTYFGGGIGSFIGEKLGGFIDNLFGGGRSYSKGGGIEGSFSNKGFSGNSYSTTREEVNQWNSWMGQSGSDKKSTQVLNTATTDSLSNQFLSIQNSIANFSKALGVDASAIMSYSKAVNIETLSTAQAEEMLKARTILANTDSSTEEKEKAQKVLDDLSKITSEKFTKLFTDITNEMASLVISSDFIRSGESSADALARIATSLSVVNSVLTQFDASLLEVSQSGGNSASNLIDAFGGLEKFSQVTSDYYQNFFTETERTASSVAVLTQAFADLGIKMPEVDGSTRAWYRSQVDAVLALDKTVPANAALIASVLGLQGAVNELAPSFDSVREKAEQLKNTNRDLQDQLDILLGKETERSLELRDTTDESTKAIIRQIHAQEDLNTAADEAAKLLKTNMGYQDTLDVLTGKETKRTLELRDATDESTRVIIRQIHAQEDLNTAADEAAKAVKEVSFSMEEWLKWDKVGVWNASQFEAYNKVEDIRKKAADNYFKAQEAVTQAQQELVGALQDTIKSFEDFLATLDNASSPVDRLSTARQEFNDLSARARTGDTEAIGQLTTSGKKFLDLSKGYSKSIVDYRRDEAQVRIILKEGIKAAKEELTKLPAELQKSSDPLTAAYAKLVIARKEELDASILALAVQANVTKIEDDLGKAYLDTIKGLPNSQKLTDFYEGVYDAVEQLMSDAEDAGSDVGGVIERLNGLYTETIKGLPEADALQKFFNDTFAAVAAVADVAKSAALAASKAAANMPTYVAPPTPVTPPPVVPAAPTAPTGLGGFVGPVIGGEFSPITIPATGGSSLITEPVTGTITTNPAPVTGLSGIDQGYAEYQNLLSASGNNKTTGNSVDLFKDGTSRVLTSEGLVYSTVKETARIVNEYAKALGSEAAITKAAEFGADSSVLAELRKNVEGTPAFETGGYHSGGFRTVGESGIELEATGPSRIFNASQTASILQPKIQDNSNTDILIERLIDVCKTASTNNSLENNQIIPAVRKMANYMDRWNVIGVPTKELVA